MDNRLSRRRLLSVSVLTVPAAVGLWLPVAPLVRAQSSWDGPFVSARGGMSEDRSLYWTAVVENSNLDAALTGLEVEAVFTNQAGTIVATDKEYLGWLAPGQSQGVHGFTFLSTIEEPGRISVKVVDYDWRPLGQPGFEGIRYVPGRFSNSIQGVIRNPYPVDFADVEVVAVCWGGDRIVGGGSGFVRQLPATGTAALSITAHVTSPPDRIDLTTEW